MSIDKTIDLLHAIAHQFDGNTVTLDGESFFIEEICERAIGIINTEYVDTSLDYD